MRKEDVELDERDEKEIGKAIKEVRKIKVMKAPPPVKKKSYCRTCAYYNFCFI